MSQPRGGARPTGPEIVIALEDKESHFQGEIAPNVYAFGSQRPMGRIRAYSAAGLTPFAGRGAPSEFHLVGHVHVGEDGKISRIEGFNGAEGERWAKQAKEKAVAKDALGPDALVTLATPLRGCVHTGIR